MSDQLRWILICALAQDITHCVTTKVGPQGAGLACQLGLADRIWCRVPEAQIRRELGAGAQQLAFAHLATRAAHAQVLGALERVTGVTGALGIPVVILKYGALALGGHTRAGSRDARDLDVLVPSESAQSLHERLRAGGMHPTGQRAPKHHLPGLRNERGEAVEVHRYIPGLFHLGRELDATTILSEGWAQRVESHGQQIFIPEKRLLIAHAVVHGVVQHLESPRDYTLTRMLCDLSDLGVGSPEFDASSVAQWFGRGISAVELQAVCSLVRTLEAGLLPKPGSRENVLLRHIVASACDPAYQDQLRVRRLIALLRSGQFWSSLRALSPPNRDAAQRVLRSILSEGANGPFRVKAALHRMTNMLRGAITEIRIALPPRGQRGRDVQTREGE